VTFERKAPETGSAQIVERAQGTSRRKVYYVDDVTAAISASLLSRFFVTLSY